MNLEDIADNILLLILISIAIPCWIIVLIEVLKFFIKYLT